MTRQYQYDVVISVAEEDLAVAQQIETALQRRKVSCYLYSSRLAENWGEHIMRISLDKYGAEARYVLMIISRSYVKKHWSSIEREIMQVSSHGKRAYLLPLRLDNTKVDGLSGSISYLEWKNDPEVIAAAVVKKLAMRPEKKRRPIGKAIAITVTLSLTVAISLPITVYITNNYNSALPAQKDSSLKDTGGSTATPGTSQKRQQDAPPQHGTITITGLVTDAATGEPLDGVQVTVGNAQVWTSQGRFSVSIRERYGNDVSVHCIFLKEGYETGTRQETFEFTRSMSEKNIDAQLTPKPKL